MHHHLPPIDAQPITGRSPEVEWGALGWSLLFHVVLAAVILLFANRTPLEPPKSAEQPGAALTPMERMVYLTPPAVPRPLPRPSQRPEPEQQPPKPTVMPRPQVERAPLDVPDAPADAAVTAPGSAASAPAAPSAPPAQPSDLPAPTAVASAATMESEAQRLFGPRKAASNSGPAPGAPRTAGPTDDRENDCTPTPRAPRAAGTPIPLEYVEGTVFYDASRRVPLPGAHLQISGTAYGAFADDRGHYRLGFDPALIDNCRSQYVRVLAPGVPPQLIVLGRGPGGTDIYLRR